MYGVDLDTGFVMARSVALRDFSLGQLVAVVSGLLSLMSSLAGEKAVSSRAELRP